MDWALQSRCACIQNQKEKKKKSINICMKTVKETEIMIRTWIMKSQKSRTIRREIDDELSFLRNVKWKSWRNPWKSVGKPKNKKKKSKTSMINSYLIGVTCKIFFVAENTTPRETKNKEKDLKRERIGGGGRRWEEEKRISC